MKKIIKIINIILCVLTIISLFILGLNIIKLNILPSKYLILVFIFILILLLINILLSFKNKHTFINVISSIIYIVFILLSLFGSNYINHTTKFIHNTHVNDYETINYSVVVLKNSSYNELKDLNNKSISYLDSDYNDKIKNKLSSIKYEENSLKEVNLLSKSLINNETDALVLEDEYYNLLDDEMHFKELTRVIYTFKIKVKSFKKTSNSIDIEKPVVMYISGIDQYGDVNSVSGRSDVNILVIVNPKTEKILLVNTPRDYYVQLSGTTGLRDKLTHAGIYGIEKSVNTLSDLYGIEINNYVRVNFNTLIKVVDVIGGVDVYSDRYLRPGINEGWNHFDGKTALSYARERHAYESGDRHRGENQQQIISAIIKKVTSSEVLITKYTSILDALTGSFQTDVPSSTITDYIKYQIDKKPVWNIESISVTGSDSMDYTYSMGTDYLLYVMEPDIVSLNNAKDKINEVMNAN